MHTHKLSVACLILIAAQFVAKADTVYLTDGSKREGTVTEDDGVSVKLRVKHGPLSATVEIPRKEIARVEFKAVASNDDDEIQFQLLSKEAERLALLDEKMGSEAWLRFARFCDERQGYGGYAKTAFEKVIALDGNNAEARKALGYEFGETGWTRPSDALLTVGPRYVAQPTPYTSPTAITVPASQTYASEPVGNGNASYSRETYYVGDRSSRSNYANSTLYLGSVNGRLQPISQSQFYSRYVYGNTGSNNSWNSNTSNVPVQYGRTGYYSDGYYRSSGYGGMTHVTSPVTTTKTRITTTGSSGSYDQNGYRR